MRYNPWVQVGQRPDIEVSCRADLQGAEGAWVPSERVILLSGTLGWRARRSVLAHELVHLELGHQPSCLPWFARRQERDAINTAARRLVPVEALAGALSWSQDVYELAEELDVDVPTVRARLDCLTNEEKDYIDSRLEAAEKGIA